MKPTPDCSIRESGPGDLEAMRGLWNRSVQAGEVVYSPLESAAFARKFTAPGHILLVAEAQGAFAGWVHGSRAEGGDGFLTAVFVEPSLRRQGVGSALLQALEDRFSALGKDMLVCSGNNPVHLDWRIPGTPGHDHNNAPGVDRDSAGYAFLKAQGFQPRFDEVAMYRDLAEYHFPPQMAEVRDNLRTQGIVVGPYDGVSELEFDGMCDRVGSEYWREVLRTELAAWKQGAPNADPALWVDGTPPKGPRPLLLAVCEGHIVGFTGPVDVQRSGRGWFTGICVDPNYGRRSIGALLFHQLLQAFVDQGAAFTTLFTGAENHAQQIYLRAGLRVVREFTVMAKPLRDGASYGQTHY